MYVHGRKVQHLTCRVTSLSSLVSGFKMLGKKKKKRQQAIITNKTSMPKEWKRVTSEYELLVRLLSGRGRKPKLFSCPCSLIDVTEYVTGLCAQDQFFFCKDTPRQPQSKSNFPLMFPKRLGKKQHPQAALLSSCPGPTSATSPFITTTSWAHASTSTRGQAAIRMI